MMLVDLKVIYIFNDKTEESKHTEGICDTPIDVKTDAERDSGERR